MTGQGKTIKAYALKLEELNWKVLYTCVPNRVHIGVVPIPTSHGVSRQRYPDIVATNGPELLLVEVEMSLTDNVFEDISLRFNEMLGALNNQETWVEWSKKLEKVSGVSLKKIKHFKCELLIANNITKKQIHNKKKLESMGIKTESI